MRRICLPLQAWTEFSSCLKPSEDDPDGLGTEGGWFSPYRAHALFRIFKALDSDLDGVISQVSKALGTASLACLGCRHC